MTLRRLPHAPHPLAPDSQTTCGKTGYVDGRNVSIEFRSAGGNLELIPSLTRELVGLGVDVLLTAGGEVSIRAAKEATSTIPVVMVAVDFDPIAWGYVASLARPGGNLTGVIFQQRELTAKRLELLTQAFPKVSRVAVLWDTYAADQVSVAVEAPPRFTCRLSRLSCGVCPMTMMVRSEWRSEGAPRPCS